MCIGLYQDITPVGTDDISVDGVNAYLRTSHIVEVKDCSHLLTRLE